MSDQFDFKPGDCIVVKSGVKDPDCQIDIGGWQGRIEEVDEFDDETLVSIRWDSVTLKAMPAEVIEQCESAGWAWTEISLNANDIEPATCRDSEQEVDHVVHTRSRQYEFAHLGDQGMRIQQVIAGVDEDDEFEAMETWAEHLERNLQFPFEAKVDEFEERFPLRRGERVTVKSIAAVDDLYGVVVKIICEGKAYDYPLCDLAALDKESVNYRVIKDYRVWFANR